jgi:hypothetical protein
MLSAFHVYLNTLLFFGIMALVFCGTFLLHHLRSR